MLTARFEEALVFATRLHAGQTRKGSDIPYVSHLLAVAATVLEQGGGEDEAIAALLHDAIEDQGGAKTRDEIARRFGSPVAAIVEACSDSDTVPKPPWRARKEAFIARLYQAPDSVRLVAAADKLHNARSILADYQVHGEALWDRFTATKEENFWYYRTLRDAFMAVGPRALAEALDRVVSELEERAGMSSTAG